MAEEERKAGRKRVQWQLTAAHSYRAWQGSIVLCLHCTKQTQKPDRQGTPTPLPSPHTHTHTPLQIQHIWARTHTHMNWWASRVPFVIPAISFSFFPVFLLPPFLIDFLLPQVRDVASLYRLTPLQSPTYPPICTLTQFVCVCRKLAKVKVIKKTQKKRKCGKIPLSTKYADIFVALK